MLTTIKNMEFLVDSSNKSNSEKQPFTFTFTNKEGVFRSSVNISTNSESNQVCNLVYKDCRFNEYINLFHSHERSNLYMFTKITDDSLLYIYFDQNDPKRKSTSANLAKKINYESEILGINSIDETIIVSLKNKVIVSHDIIKDMETSHVNSKTVINTFDNPNGIFTIKKKDNVLVLATLGNQKGEINVVKFKNGIMLSEKIIQAHSNEIEDIAISHDLKFLASASSCGTLIKVFDISSDVEFAKVNEFRRGSSIAKIYSLTFNYANTYLACGSSNGTVHIFDLENTKNTKSYLNSISFMVPSLFGSEWMSSNWAYKTYPYLNLDPNNNKILCEFDKHFNGLHVLSYDGTYSLIYGDTFDSITEKIEISRVPSNYKITFSITTDK